MSDPRAEVLRRIRAALRDVPPGEQSGDVPVPRDYRRRDSTGRDEIVARFAERVGEYRATVKRIEEASLPAAIAVACRERGVHRLVVPPDLPQEWLPEDVEAVRDDELSAQQLDAFDGVLTGCALGIAQTGTIALDGGAHQGRRALTLVPDYHLCVVLAEQVVGIVPEAIAKLEEAAHTGRPITLISGPSATSDIELNRVEGVHGPRTLDVLIIS